MDLRRAFTLELSDRFLGVHLPGFRIVIYLRSIHLFRPRVELHPIDKAQVFCSTTIQSVTADNALHISKYSSSKTSDVLHKTQPQSARIRVPPNYLTTFASSKLAKNFFDFKLSYLNAPVAIPYPTNSIAIDIRTPD